MVGSRFRVARRHQHSISRPSCAMPVALLCAVLAIGVMCDARVCAQAPSVRSTDAASVGMGRGMRSA